ncbi:MAG: hypothetical protein ACK5GI_07215, partial [Ignavibacteria bacterium]
MTTSIRLIIAGILMGVNVYASELTLTIAPRAEDQSLFKLGNVYAGKAKGGFYSPSMLRYYISGITL